jgi:putative DNA primase/helicase
LCVHSEVKGQESVAAFLADADLNSRKYDIVIASPVISSGVSIEHRDGAHFTLGAYVGGGWATTPADAMQQMGRVRYLRRFIVGIEKNNSASGGQVWSEEIRGRVRAANLEQSSTLFETFDGLIAHLKATHENARSDFGAGLYWHLEAGGWEVLRKEIVVVDEAVSQIAKQLTEDHKNALQAVGHVDDCTANLLRRMPETEETAIILEAYAIQQAFAVDVVTEDELLFWDNGSFARNIERFEDAFGIGAVDLEQASQIVHRSMRAARRLAYVKLLDGIDIRSPDWGTPAVLEKIVDRMMLEPELYVSTDILPKKYAARRKRRDDTYKPIKRPTNVGIVGEEILTRLGLKATKTRTRIDGLQVRVVGTDMDVFARVLVIAERRGARKAATTFEWGEDEAPYL